MNLTIREHIISNFQNDDYYTIREAINESVKEKDEYTLPGLGVFFELVWENSSQEIKHELVEIIRKRVQKGLYNHLLK